MKDTQKRKIQKLSFITFITMLSLIIFNPIYSFANGENNNANNPKQTLAQYFEEEVVTIDSALQTENSVDSMIANPNSDDGYFFRRFWLRLRPRVERDIPWLAGFSVIPELELLFEKQTPDGWENYKIEKKHK